LLSENISPYNPLVAQQLQHPTVESLLQLNQTVTSQGLMLSTIDLFAMLTVLFLFLTPFIFFTKKAASGH